MTHDDFLKFKDKFLKTIRFEGLIGGHLTQEDAKRMCSIISDSIVYKPLNPDDVILSSKLTKLPENSVHNFDLENPVPEGENPQINPNSCVRVYF